MQSFKDKVQSVLKFARRKFRFSANANQFPQSSTLSVTPAISGSNSSDNNRSALAGAKDISNLKHGDYIDQWKVISFVGEGAFGCVYKVTEDEKVNYALKFDYNNDENSLDVEKHVLQMAKKAMNKHMCKFIDDGKAFNYSYVVMTLVGRTLQDLIRMERKFTMGCALSVGKQCLEAIEELHRIGFIHRDIKPSNYAAGLKECGELRKIYLLDFGFCYQYVDSNDKIKTVKKRIAFKGTTRYASLASHYNIAPGRRDDLESWLYQQTEFTKGVLPWRHLENNDEVAEYKEQAQTKEGMRNLLRGCPRYYLDIFKYIINLKQRSQPDYDFLFKILKKTIFESGESEYPYDWEHGPGRPGSKRCAYRRR